MSDFFLFGDKFNCTLINLEKIDSVNFENVGSGSMYKVLIKYTSGASDEIEVMQDQIAKFAKHLGLGEYS